MNEENNKIEHKHTIKELIEECCSRRIENTLEYRKSVCESNELIKKYQEYQAKVYAEADNFIANKSLVKKLEK